MTHTSRALLSGLFAASLLCLATPAFAQDPFEAIVSNPDGATVRLYVNGAEDGNWPESSMSAPSADTFLIAEKSIGVKEFDGVLDDVRLYSRVLCAAEIATFYSPPSSVRIVSWNEVSTQ